MNRVDRKAYGKLNLTLEILSKRPDGYHEVRSVLQMIDIADHLRFEAAPSLTLEGDLAGTTAEDNLVMRAARLLQKESGTSHGAAILLRKVIPVASGMGGGSSDAAATLRGLNDLWSLGLTIERLTAMAAHLGSDVPFFIQGGCALVEGRGEVITPLRDPPEAWFVLFCLPTEKQNKTAEMYARVTPQIFSRGDRTPALVADIQAGKAATSAHFFNGFEGVAFGEFEDLREFYLEISRMEAPQVRLTGTGPTLFGLVKNEADGQELLLRCDRRGLPVYLVKTVARQL